MTNKTSEKNKYGPPIHVKYPKSIIIQEVTRAV